MKLHSLFLGICLWSSFSYGALDEATLHRKAQRALGLLRSAHPGDSHIPTFLATSKARAILDKESHSASHLFELLNNDLRDYKEGLLGGGGGSLSDPDLMIEYRGVLYAMKEFIGSLINVLGNADIIWTRGVATAKTSIKEQIDLAKNMVPASVTGLLGWPSWPYTMDTVSKNTFNDALYRMKEALNSEKTRVDTLALGGAFSDHEKKSIREALHAVTKLVPPSVQVALPAEFIGGGGGLLAPPVEEVPAAVLRALMGIGVNPATPITAATTVTAIEDFRVWLESLKTIPTLGDICTAIDLRLA